MKIQHGYGDKRIIVRKLCLFLLFLCFIIVVSPDGETKEVRSEKRIPLSLSTRGDDELGYIYGEFSKLLPDGILDSDGAVGIFGLEEVYDYLSELVCSSGSGFLKELAFLFGIAVIFALAEMLGAESGGVSETVRAGACICFSVPMLTSFMDKIAEASAGMSSGCEFFSGVIPLLCSVAAIGGGTAVAATSGASMSITLGLVSRVLVSNLLPLATFLYTAAIVSSFDTGQKTQRILKGARTVFNFLMGAASVILLATVGLQSVIASAKDTLAVRSAKYAISGMIPAVGGTISSTLSTLISGASVMMSTMGAASVAALSLTMGKPLAVLLLYRFAIQLCIGFSSLFGSVFAEKLFESFRSSLDSVLVALCSTLIIFILEVVVFMKTGVPVS